MPDVLLLRSLGFILIAAALCVVVSRPARMPSIVAYILAGLVLGPATGLLEVTETIDLIADAGIALLLFIVGLELSFARIRDVGRVAVLAGLGQVLFTAAGGSGLALLLGFGVMDAVFIGTALTFSSTVVVVKLLDQKHELHSLYGRIAVGIFLVQDLVVIVALTVLAGLGRQDGAGWGETGRGLVLAFAGMAALLAGALAAARWMLPRLFGWVIRSPETTLIWSLAWCFLFVVAALALDLSLEIGAFLAGVSLAQLPYNQDLRRRVHPLMNFFIAVFFVSLGIHMELGAAAAHWGAAVAFSLFVLIGNPFIFMWIIAKLGYSERTSFLTSVTVAQISEFSFVFAALGLSTGLIGGDVLAVIAIVGLVTIAVSAYMILYNHGLYAVVRRWGLLRAFRARPEPELEPEPELHGHVIVVGMNGLGRPIVRRLAERGERVLAIDTDPGKLAGLPAIILVGNVDYASTLEEARLPSAKLVVSALQIEDTNNLLAYRCRALGVPCSIHVFDESVEDELSEIGPHHMLLSKNAGLAHILAALERAGLVAG